MFRSLIEEKIRFWHVWMDLICPVLLWPSSVLPGITAGPLCPLGCQEHLGTADEKEPWGRAPWEQCWRHLCAWGNPMKSFCPGESIQGGAFTPVHWELPFSSPCKGDITHPAQIQTGISKHRDVPGSRQRITGCRNKFSGSAFFRFYLFIVVVVCLENIGAMQVPEESNPGHTALEMKKKEI